MSDIIEKLGITPGPWHFHEWSEDIEITKNHSEICTTCKKGYENSVRDLRLIASAPEMLKAIIKWVASGEGIRQFKDVVQTEIDFTEVIEKATGKTWEEIKELL
jgi:hypothetical protein